MNLDNPPSTSIGINYLPIDYYALSEKLRIDYPTQVQLQTVLDTSDLSNVSNSDIIKTIQAIIDSGF